MVEMSSLNLGCVKFLSKYEREGMLQGIVSSIKLDVTNVKARIFNYIGGA